MVCTESTGAWISMALDIRIWEGKNREIPVISKKKTRKLIKASLMSRIPIGFLQLQYYKSTNISQKGLFPLQHFRRNGINNYHPDTQDTNFLPAFQDTQPFERNFTDCVIVLGQGQQPADLL